VVWVFVLGVLACVLPSRALARKVTTGFYLEIRGDESIKKKLLAKLESLPCFEEADLHSTEIYETTKEPGGECHAFQRFRRSACDFPFLLKIAIKGSLHRHRKFTLVFYELHEKRFELDFDAGTYEFPDVQFVKEAANEIVIRTFMLPPPESHQHRRDEETIPIDDSAP
jgi:hypothetical protein